MWHFALRRGTVLLLTLLLVSIVAFLIPYIGEGDPALLVLRARIADPNVDQATLEAMRHQLGLDRHLRPPRAARPQVDACDNIP